MFPLLQTLPASPGSGYPSVFKQRVPTHWVSLPVATEPTPPSGVDGICAWGEGSHQFGVPTLRLPSLLPGRWTASPDLWVPQACLHTGGDTKPTWPACYACHLWVPSPSPGLQNLCFWRGLWVTLVMAMFDSCTHLACTPSPSIADSSSP